MIIQTFALHNLTEQDALEMRLELLRFFEKNKAKDYPQLAAILQNLSKIFL